MTVFAQVAARDIGESIRNYQTGSSSEFVVFAIAVVILLGLALGGWWFVHARRRRRQPLLLFYDLAEYHDITRAQQKKVLALARAHNVEDPACLFVCPELVERIQSQEASEAANEKELRRLRDLLGGFARTVFGSRAGAEAEAEVNDEGRHKEEPAGGSRGD